MFSQAKLYLFGGVLLALIALGTTAYIYKLKYERAEIERTQAQQQRDTMLEVNRQIIDGIARDASLRQKLYSDLKGARDAAETYKQKLASHDLSKLARAKPGLLTLLARRATKRVLDDIQTAVNRDAPVPEPAERGQPEAETAPADGAADRRD